MRASQVMEMNLKAIEASMREHSTESRYSCPDCGKQVSDVMMTIPVSGKKVKIERYGCLCYQKKELETYLQESDSVHCNDIYEQSGIGKRFQHCTFENFKVFPEVADAFNAVAEYTEQFEEHKKNGTGLILKGVPGSGKTHLACALSQDLIFRGFMVKFVVTPVLFETIKQSFNRKTGEVEADSISIKQLSEVGLLVLDDFGSESLTSWSREQLFILINRRYEQMKPTIITTNFNGQQLAERVGERIASRFAEVSKIINIKAGDYRMKKAI